MPVSQEVIPTVDIFFLTRFFERLGFAELLSRTQSPDSCISWLIERIPTALEQTAKEMLEMDPSLSKAEPPELLVGNFIGYLHTSAILVRRLEALKSSPEFSSHDKARLERFSSFIGGFAPTFTSDFPYLFKPRTQPVGEVSPTDLARLLLCDAVSVLPLYMGSIQMDSFGIEMESEGVPSVTKALRKSLLSFSSEAYSTSVGDKLPMSDFAEALDDFAVALTQGLSFAKRRVALPMQ
jgi:hypothetical protein